VSGSRRGNDQLREQLEAMDDSLRAFEDPPVDEAPGLRLMAETLPERRSHIRDQIRKNETCSLQLRLVNAAVDDEAVAADVIADLVAAVSRATVDTGTALAARWQTSPAAHELDAALRLYVRKVDIGSTSTIEMSRRPGPIDAQLADPDAGVPLVEIAAATVSRVLADFCNGSSPDVGATLREPLAQLAGALLRAGAVLRWSLEPFVLDDIELEVTQTDAQRLLQLE
jgi:hypothetical protein